MLVNSTPESTNLLFNRKKSMRFLVLIFVLVFASGSVFAQNISMEETLAFINGKLSGKYKLRIDRRELVIDVFNEDEGHVRRDRMMIDDLSWESIKYYPSDTLLVMRCEDEGYDCVNRDLLIKGLKDQIHRFSFVVTDEKDAEALKKALIHMIRLVREKKYKSSEPFE